LKVPARMFHRSDIFYQDLTVIMGETYICDLTIGYLPVMDMITVRAMDTIVTIKCHVKLDIKIFFALCTIKLVFYFRHV